VVPVSSGSLQWTSKYCGSPRRKVFSPSFALRAAGPVGFDFLQSGCVGKTPRAIGKPAEILQRVLRGETSSISPRAPRRAPRSALTHIWCTASFASCEPFPGPRASATKKRVSKRARGRAA